MAKKQKKPIDFRPLSSSAPTQTLEDELAALSRFRYPRRAIEEDADIDTETEEVEQYVVGDGEDEFGSLDFVIINAHSKREAINRYKSEKEVDDELFIENTYSKTVNSGFSETFWFQTDAEDARWNSKMELSISDDQFKERVHTFFGEHDDYARLYIDWYFDDERGADDGNFPREMLVYIRMNKQWSKVVAVRLDNVRRFA